jgi:NitT/TauT family transport system substrate-binding protein
MDRLSDLNVVRRNFLKQGSAMAMTSLLGLNHITAAAEPAPEISRLRLTHAPSICLAPQYIAEDLLRLEGFSEISYLPLGSRLGPFALAEGRADITMWDVPGLIPHLDAGKPIVLLSGVHDGCYELFGNDRVRAIRDLKGKTIAVQYYGGGDHVMLQSILAYVGINPKEVNWIAGENVTDAMNLFVNGKADVFLAYSQQSEELRQRKIGHVIINTAEDRPWSQYFCCAIAANRDFTKRYPVATKRALRALLKAVDACAADPLRAARFLSDKLYEPRFQIGLNVMKRLSYKRWREADLEDTVRFHALRLHEVGMIKTAPEKLIEQGTDWRFLNELKREMKA